VILLGHVSHVRQDDQQLGFPNAERGVLCEFVASRLATFFFFLKIEKQSSQANKRAKKIKKSIK
jgi:hypothetical protein